MTGRSLLITGATGILGSWVLAEALDRGFEVHALMRDDTEEGARERLASVLQLADRPGLESAVHIVRGDASAPALGIDDRNRRTLVERIDGMIHCAACTSFSNSQDEEILRTNVGGVENVLAFVRGAGIPLYHVSTAYVSGRRHGQVLEADLGHEAGFNNTYEMSKNRSESLVQSALAAGDISGAVFRPAIIVGASSNGRICQFVNFYNFMQVLDFAVMRKGRGLSCFRLNANPACTKNLAPVDWTAQAMWHILDRDGASGLTYHLTNPDPPTHADLVAWGNAMLEPYDMRIEFEERPTEDVPTFKKAMRGNFEHFEAYLETEAVFDRTNTDRALGGTLPFPAVDHAQLTRMLDYARSQRWRSIFGKRTRGDRTYLDNLVVVKGADSPPSDTTDAARVAIA